MKVALYNPKTEEIIYRDMNWNQMQEAIRDGFFVNPFIPQDKEEHTT